MNKARYFDRCIFDEQENFCSGLIEKKCEGCKFRKTVQEYTDAQRAAEISLGARGLEAYRTRNEEGQLIVTTRKLQRWQQ